MLRRFAPYADPVLLPAVTAINGLGLAVIHRLDLAYADRAEPLGTDVPSAAAPAQLTWTAVGVALFVAVLLLVRDHRVLQRFTYTAMVVGLGLLLLPLLPLIGTTINGARIWIRLAGLLVPARRARQDRAAGVLRRLPGRQARRAGAGRHDGCSASTCPAPATSGRSWSRGRRASACWSSSATSARRCCSSACSSRCSTSPPSGCPGCSSASALFLSGSFLAWTLFGHVQERVDIWLNAFAPRNVDDDSYQLVQGLFGMGTGGLLGKGLGQGRPEIVPYAKTDFIVAAIGEELGLAGLMAVLIVYAIVVQRGLRTAIAVRDSFGKLLAAGLAFSIALQVFVVVGGVTRLIPLTGLTMPFLSYGGSSLVANWAIVALLLRISDAARRPAPPPAPSPAGRQDPGGPGEPR